MPLRNLIKPGLVSCSREASVRELAKLMESKDVGAVVVTENENPVGIVTDRDIAIRCVAQEADCSTLLARDIMTKTPNCVKIGEGIFNVIEQMENFQVRRIPVIDESGRAVGLVSFGDVFDLLSTELHKLAAPATPEKKKIQEHAA